MSGPATYWHLTGRQGPPDDYDITSTRLIPQRPQADRIPTTATPWVARHGAHATLHCDDWDAFADPRRTTYATYVELQHRRQTHLDALLSEEATGRHRGQRSGDWLELLDRLIPTLRYPVHGLQMVTAYIANMSPGGRVMIAGTFQTADELRRVHALSQLCAVLENDCPTFGRHSRATWEDSPQWQPLRHLVERLIVTYSWGEAFAVLQLSLKPAFDALILGAVAEPGSDEGPPAAEAGAGLAARAREAGDDLVVGVLKSLAQDSLWHRAWSSDLVTHLAASNAANRRAIDGWVAAWADPVTRALEPLAALIGVVCPLVARGI